MYCFNKLLVFQHKIISTHIKKMHLVPCFIKIGNVNIRLAKVGYEEHKQDNLMRINKYFISYIIFPEKKLGQ